MSSAGADRLADAVKRRRESLGRRQEQVQAAGGPSNAIMTTVEGGKIDKLTPATARKLDMGLDWVRGSAQAVFDGTGDPIPHTAVSRLREEIEEVELSNLPPGVKAKAAQAFRDELERALAEQGRERGAS